MQPKGFRTNKRTGNVFPLFSGQTTLETFNNLQAQNQSRQNLVEPSAEAIAAYKAKQEAKATRYRQLADKAHKESKTAFDASDKLGEMIPFGQPILVGHHSERMMRRNYERIHDLFGKGLELKDKAEHYEHKAELRENPRAVSSDDPEAIKKIQSEIDALENKRHYLKHEYQVIPGISDFKEGSDHWRRIHLESISRNIREKQKRIEALRQVQEMPSIDKTINNIRILTDKDENRIKLFFPSKPTPEIIKKLKENGFHWSPFNKAWQRMISNQSIHLAEEITKG